MKRIFKLVVLLLFSIFFNCKKITEKINTKKSQKLVLEKIGSFDNICWSIRTGKKDYERMNYENDSVCYRYGINYYDYQKPQLSEDGTLYISGKKYSVKITPKNNDSIIKLYNLKKIEFKPKRNYQNHFEYEDCILHRKIKMDSGVVHIMQAKNGVIYQVIDIKNKPILFQFSYQGKANKERIPSTDIYGKLLLGNGYSYVMLYDIDKDKKQELLFFFDKEMCSSADVYKINLPK